MQNPAAWHPDPFGRFQHRYWDGQRWTEHVSTNGVASVDAPVQVAPPTTPTPTAPQAWGPPQHASGGAAATATAAPQPAANSNWTSVAALDSKYQVQPTFELLVQRSLGQGEWVLTAQNVSGTWDHHRARYGKGLNQWAVVTNGRLVIFDEKGFTTTRYQQVAAWNLTRLGEATYGPLFGAGPTWEVAFSAPNGSSPGACSIYCHSDPHKSEILCSALNSAREAVRAGRHLPWPSERWSVNYSAAAWVGAEITVASGTDVERALARRPDRCVLLVSERSVGRDEFDSSVVCRSISRVVEQMGYSVARREVFGTPPSLAWMGPGDRTARLTVERN